MLPAAQKELWPQLKPSVALKLVLYGGTAIALRLGHRKSVDFDFFTERALDKRALRAAFPFIGKATLLQDEPDVLTVTTDMKRGPVKVSFFGGIGHGHFEPPQLTDDGVLRVASPGDLLATKLKTVLQRIEAKDYRDIAALIKHGGDLPKALASAREMYGSQFQPAVSLKAMTYFQGGDLHLLTPAERAILVKAAAAVRDLPHVKRLSRRLSGD